MQINTSLLDLHRIHADFQRLKNRSDQNIRVQKALGESLLQRLWALNLQPQTIVDLSAGQSLFTEMLAQHYPQATVVAVDYTQSQLERSKGSLAALLSFADATVDVIFCPLMLQWCADPKVTLLEIQRVLKPNGVFLFSVLGPDSLTELRQAFLTISDKPYFPTFTDMHNWGDLLLQTQFKNPVVDVDYFSLYYTSFSQVMSALRRGPTYFLKDINKGLITPRQWQHLEEAYERYRDENGLVLTLEVVYGIAFGSDRAQRTQQPQEASIPVQNIQRKK